MTRQDCIIKWLLYGLSVLPVWWLELYVLGNFPVFGVTPLLLPLAVVAVALHEGAVGGAGFGLCVGILCNSLYDGTGGIMTLALTLVGMGVGLMTQYVLSQTLWGQLLTSAMTMGLLSGGQMLVYWFGDMATLSVLLGVAIPEIFVSLLYVFLLYPYYVWVKKRIDHIIR